MTSQPTSIKLYTFKSPNGQKISILFRLLGIDFEIVKVDLTKGEQKTPEFKKLNPSETIPVVEFVDSNGVKQIFGESAVIMKYFLDHYDTNYQYHYPNSDPLFYEQYHWEIFQAATLGPSLVTNFIAKLTNVTGVGRKEFLKRVNKYYDILDQQIAKNGTGYIIGDKLSAVDVAFYSWATMYPQTAENDWDSVPNIKKWVDLLSEHPAIQKGTADVNDAFPDFSFS
ncbi:hypothetical protein DASC09_048520 [Saccharomycopsis crataegensis]|uniref:Glutathione S-transferase n=1 Tax=Saccharomycopsis crataegensis TaxID=43959 RepID=A0AAV5QRL1_9ASCO|nr:hypothetical protein DASC09_048520 [Saccharomycopsis crataegensis]